MHTVTPTPSPQPGLTAAAAGHGVEARLLVIADLRSGSPSFQPALSSLGENTQITQSVWALRTSESVGAVRNRLGAETRQGDRLIVVDATRDRFAHLGLGPEVESRLRQIWRTPLLAT